MITIANPGNYVFFVILSTIWLMLGQVLVFEFYIEVWIFIEQVTGGWVWSLHWSFLSDWSLYFTEVTTQLTFTCSKLTIKTLEKGVKYVQS